MSKHPPTDVLLERLAHLLEDARLVALHGSTPAQRAAAVEKAQRELEALREAL